MPRKSLIPIITTRVVSLNKLINCPAMAGSTARNAWGNTINTVVFKLLIPRAFAASICPRGTDCKPPRTFSAEYAALKTVTAIRARTRRSIRDSTGKNKARMMENIKRIVTSGTPRITSMKMVENPLNTGRSERRPKAKATPKGKESNIPPAASKKVTNNPPQRVVGTFGISSLFSIPANRTTAQMGMRSQPTTITLALTAFIRPMK